MTSNYPPYNIKKVGKEKYQLEMALAGFTKTDVIVEVKENTLTISGKASDKDTDTFVHRYSSKVLKDNGLWQNILK